MKNKPDRILSMLGLAMRAGKIASGEVAVENAIKSGKAWIVVVPVDASDNTAKQFKNMCDFRQIPCLRYGTKDTLGHCLGKAERSSVAVLDKGFATQIENLLQVQDDGTNGGK